MEHFYRACAGAWNGLLKLLSTIAWPAAIGGGLALSVLLVVMYFSGAFTPKKSIEEARQETALKLSEDEREYIAVAVIRDAMIENEPLRVQEGIAIAVINYRKKYDVDIPTIVRESLTMIPVGYKRKGFMFSTSKTYVKTFEASSGQWTGALAVADRVIAKQSGALSDKNLACATQYVRKDRKTHTESPEAIAQLESQLREVPKPDVPNPGVARFFCPK